MRYKSMPKRIINAVIIVSAITLAFSCSSAPEKSDIINTRKNRAADLSAFGNNYLLQGQYSQALVFFNLALDENVAADFEPGISRAGNSIAKIYLLTGDKEQAEKYLKEAYDLAEKTGDSELIALSALNYSELSLLKGLNEDADRYLSQALSGAAEGSQLYAEVYHAMAASESRKGNLENALSHISVAAGINTRLKSHSHLASNHYLAASVHSRLGNLEKAVENLLLAVQEDRKEENSLGLAKDYKALGIVYFKNNRPEESYPYFVKSYRIFSVLGNGGEMAGVLDYLIKNAQALGRPVDEEYFRQQLQKIKG